VRHGPISTSHPGKLLADETVPWKAAFRVHGLLAARWEGQSVESGDGPAAFFRAEAAG